MRELKPVVEYENASPWPTLLENEALRSHFFRVAGQNYGDAIGEFSDGAARWALDVGNMRTIAERLTDRVIDDPTWVNRQFETAEQTGEEMIAFTHDEIYRANLRNATNSDLFNLYRTYREKFFAFYPHAWLPDAVQGPRDVFSRVLKDYLLEQLGDIDKQHKIGEYFTVLTTPQEPSVERQEERSFLEVAAKIVDNTKAKRLFKRKTLELEELSEELRKQAKPVYRAILRHAREYEWLPFEYQGPAWSREDLLKRWRTLVRRGKNVERALEKMDRDAEKRREKREKFARSIGLDRDGRYRYLFRVAREFMMWKDRRKALMTQSFFHVDKLIQEIADQTNTDPDGVRFVLPAEMRKFLTDEERQKEIRREFDKRARYSVVVVTKNKVRILTGKPAEDFGSRVFRERSIDEDVTELDGDSVFPGKAKGTVRVIDSIHDIAKVKEGDIVVTPRANPNMIAAFRKAAAVVADTGGITSHAAVLCRDLEVPCIVGTDIAARALSDGDSVKINANEETGIVTVVKRS